MFRTKQTITDASGQGLQGIYEIKNKICIDGRMYYIIADADNKGNNLYIIHFTEVVEGDTVEYLR